MSSVARVKFIKTNAFRYHTKGFSNQVLSNLDHEIKLFMFQNVLKWEKTKKWKKFLPCKTGQKGNCKSGQVLGITNRGETDYKSGQRDFKSVQGLQIGAEHSFLTKVIGQNGSKKKRKLKESTKQVNGKFHITMEVLPRRLANHLGKASLILKLYLYFMEKLRVN